MEGILKFQLEFKAYHLQLQQLLCATEYNINSIFEKRCHLGAVCIDIAKTFEKLWYESYLFKLEQINIPIH